MSATCNFLLEIGVEELPARVLQPISEHIKTSLENLFISNSLSFSDFNIAYTPRRLFFEVKDLVAASSDKQLEIKGPPANVAFVDGKYTQAALGFAAKNGVKEADLYIDNAYVYARVSQQGVSTAALLEANIARIITETPGERFMRSADGSLKFSRPLRWIMALMVGAKPEILKIELDGLGAGDISYGHRFLSPEAFRVTSAEQYRSELTKRGVILELAERKQLVRDKSIALAATLKAEVQIDESLLEEVINLVENPEPILCEFNEQFMKIPQQVLITVMAKHQRYFPLLRDGKLIPYFIAVSNNPLAAARANIKSGNEKVIIPRFKDAEFFVEEDSKTTLSQRLPKLEKINFQAGNMLQKAHRIQTITKYMLEELAPNYPTNPTRAEAENLNDKNQSKAILEAALLAKADLTSHLVFEFTELQGEIGGVYAAREGLDKVLACSIGEHYMPRFAGDNLPSSIGGKIISVADRLDTLVCFFAAGKIPKGSADPFALRRQANGLLEIVLHSHWIINLDKLVDYVVDLAAAEFGTGRLFSKSRGSGESKKTIEVPEFDWNLARTSVKEFLIQRLPFVFEISHKNTEINKAVLEAANPLVDLNRRHMMVHLMYNLRARPEFPSLVEAITRVVNIGDRSIGAKVSEGSLNNEHEQSVYACFKHLDVLLAKPTYYEPLAEAEFLKAVEPVNKFFDNVLVNDKDDKVKINRHALVNYGASVFEQVCAFKLLSV